MGFQNTGIWLTVKPKCLTETETNESNKKMKWLWLYATSLSRWTEHKRRYTQWEDSGKVAEHETSGISLPESSARTIIALAESVWRNCLELWTLMKVWNFYRKIWMVNLVHFGQFQPTNIMSLNIQSVPGHCEVIYSQKLVSTSSSTLQDPLSHFPK